MKTLFFLLATFCASFLTTTAVFAQDNFLTSRDLFLSDATSNLSLYNNRSTSVTVYGLYVNQYSYVTPGNTCASSTVIYPSSNNVTAGSFVTPLTIAPGQKAAIGGNYLYNMIFTAIYYENIIIPSSPPGCALPGCTWGSDTTKYNWCIYVGALAPVTTTAGYTANVPPAADAASSAGIYNYNLINQFINLGPISCNDQTLTCAAANQQAQPLS